MTPKERVIAQIHHQETDYIPYTIGFEGDVAERLDVYYGSDTWRGLIDNAIVNVPGHDLGVDDSSGETYTDLFGAKWRVDRRPWHLVEPALKEASLDGFTFPDVDACFEPGWKEKALQVIEEKKDHFLVAGFGFGLFERTWTLRDLEEVLMDTVAHPDFYDELVEQVTNHQLAVIERLLELPIDGILFSDDWGYQRGVMIGPERWRRFLKLRLARQYDRVHEAGKYAVSHCCGSIIDIMPDVIEIGLDVPESVQPEAMDPYELKRRYGSGITFWGGLGSQSVIPFGTPEEIHREVNKLCAEMGRGGGYILSSAKALQPETPTENAAAVIEAFLAQAEVEV